MAKEGRQPLRLRTQVLLLQTVVIVLTVGVAFAVFSYISGQRLSAEYGQRALAVARSVASDPAVRTDVDRYSAATVPPSTQIADELARGELQRVAAEAQQRTGALFVVITDDDGTRLAHPSPERLGETVSTDPSEALAGREVVVQERGTLGESVRAKVPVFEPESDVVVGEVSVGISTSAVRQQLLSDLRKAGLLVGLAVLLGIVGSVLLARRWRGLTLGLEPAELAELVREQAAVLHGIGEGVLAVDPAGRTTVVNDEACRLLGISAEAGRSVDEIGLTPRVLEVFRAMDGVPALAAVGERIVVVSARTVFRGGRDLGAVLIVRDRTDVESLTRQLDAVQSMSTVLRAQRHEFANRLHLLNGLIQGENFDEASHYLAEVLGSGPLGASLPGIDAIHDPYLQAFLAAKGANAREAGVTLMLGANTWVSGTLALIVDVTTVLGNLLDNAIEAASISSNAPKQVEAELVQEASTLHIAVIDSGDGIAPDFVAEVFTEGASTRSPRGMPGGGRGIGLALSRQIARTLGGDVTLSRAQGSVASLGGAEFMARLPGAMVEEESAWVT